MLNLFKYIWIIFLALICITGCYATPGDFNFNGNIQNVSNVNFFIYWLGMMEKALSGINIPPKSPTSKNASSVGNVPPPQAKLPSHVPPFEPVKPNIPARPLPEILGPDPEDDGVSLTENEEALLNLGIEVDYSFVEIRNPGDPPNKLISSPGCPFSGEMVRLHSHPLHRNVWVHFGIPPRCFLTGTRGPCPEGMIVGVQPNSTAGVCKCACYNEIDEFDNEVLDPYLDVKQKFCSTQNGLFYDHYAKYQGTCYKLFTQGPCKCDEALLFDKRSQGICCKKRQCPEAAEEPNSRTDIYGTYVHLYDSTCLRLGQECDNKHRLLTTTKDDPYPACIDPIPDLKRVSYEINKAECAIANQRYSEVRRLCVPLFKIVRSNGVG